MSRQPKIGEKVWVRKISNDKPCTVKEIKWLFVTVRPLHSRKLVEVTIDDIEYIDEEKLTGKEKGEIVKKLVKADYLNQDSSIYYRELATLNNLIKKYPDLEFWRQFSPDYQVKSLMWWLGGGSLQMNDYFNAFRLDFDSKKLIIGDKKIGDDVKIEKQLTIRDILTN